MKAYKILTMALAVLLLFCPAAVSESYEASTMRLIRYEGEVEVLDASGNARFLMENGRFASGETLSTGPAGSASVSLDSSKIVTLDEKTRTAFAREGSHLKLTLLEGSLFLDVEKKLDANETLDIETSTMTVGIRGTIVFVSEQPVAGTTQLSVLEGVSEISYQDEAGTRRVTEVPAGQTAVIRPSAGESMPAVSIGATTMADLTQFVHTQIEQSPDIGSRIEAAGGLPQTETTPVDQGENAFPADGDWTYGGEVTIFARSAGKLYDGAALSRNGDALVTGLPSEFSIQVSTSGSQTGVGTGENRVDSYAILNPMGENVTSHFTAVRTVPGKLVVSPAPLIVWTGSAEKYYDGTALTCDEAGFRTVEGAEGNAPAWRNSVIATTGDAGGAVMYGVTGKTWVHLTHPQTGEEQNVQLAAGQRLTVIYGSGEDGKPAIQLVIEKVNEQDLPPEVLAVYEGNPAMRAQACEDAGWDPEILKAEGSGAATEGNPAENLLMESVDVRVSMDSYVTSGTTRTLGSQEAVFTAVHVPASVLVTATGSQLEVGESFNTYTIDWKGEDAANYELQEELGILKVKARPQPAPEPETIDAAVTLTAGSAEKVYDGTPLTCGDAAVSGMPEGYQAEFSVSGSRTDAGSSENTIQSYAFYDGNGQNVTALFTNVQTVAGTLTVTPAQLTVRTDSAEKEYDGSPLTESGADLEGLVNGETAKVTAIGSLTDVGTAENDDLLDWGSADEKNYALTEDLGTLTVTANDTEITFTATIASRDYDGTPLTAAADSVTVTGLPEGLTWTVQVTGSQTGAGSSESEITDFRILNPSASGSASLKEAPSEDATAFFTGVKTVKGTLTVNPVEATVTTASAAKAYDGRPLTAAETEISGLVAGETATVTATGTITAVGTAENTCEIDWGSTNPGNYAVTQQLGTLEVTLNETEISFTAGSAEKTYDGTALAADPAKVTVSGLPEGFGHAVEVAGEQTDAGSSESHVSSWQILTAEGEDASAYFTSVTTAAGTLKVNPAPATVTTGSAAKVFDGQSLTASEAEISGLVAGETATVTATGTITVVGTARNTYAIEWGDTKAQNYTLTESLGTLEVTPNETEIIFTAGSDAKPYDGTPLTAGVSVTGLPEGFGYTATASGSLKDAGSCGNDVTGYQILDGSGTDVTACFSNISTVSGTLLVDPAALSISTGSASKPYDGTPLTSTELEVSGLAEGDQPVITITGSQTDVGVSSNTVAIDWGEVKSTNYVLTESQGELVVTENDTPITITSGTYAWEYAKVNIPSWKTYEVDGEIPGSLHLDVSYTYDSYEMFVPGEWDNEIQAAILDADGVDRTGNFTNVTLVYGTLSIAKGKINVWSGDRTVTYTGSSYGPTSIVFQGVWGLDNPTPSDVATSGYEYYKDAGTYHPGFTATIARADLLEKYEIGEVRFGELTIAPATLTVTTGTAEKLYDGTPLTAGASIEGLAYGDEAVTVNATGTITDAGSTDNDYSIEWNGVNPANYDPMIAEHKGTLTVKKRNVTLTSATATKLYDGTALTAETVTVGGDGFAPGEGADYLVTGEQIFVGSSPNGFVYELHSGTNADNYEISGTSGTLTVDMVTLTVNLGGTSWVYNGAEHGIDPEQVSVTHPTLGILPIVERDIEDETHTYFQISLENGTSFILNVTGSQTIVGTSEISYTVTDFDGACEFEEAYEISPVDKLITVTAAPPTDP